MNITTGRPGVFSDYTIETLYAGTGEKAVGVVCRCGGQLPLAPVKITSHTRLLETLPEDGEEDTAFTTVSLLLSNGVGTVYCVPVCGDGGQDLTESYLEGFSLLEEYGEIYAVLCDQEDTEILAGLLDHVETMSARQKERLGFAAPASQLGDAAAMAKQWNQERMCVCWPMAMVGERCHGVYLAAVTAAACACAQDPSLSLAGFTPVGLDGLSLQPTAQQVESMIQAGVTAFETGAQGVELIRLLSTRTSREGTADLTFRSLNTIMVIDHVLQRVRNALKIRLPQLKNNEASRGAIKAQAVVELKGELDAGIIESYTPPVVTQSADDPSVCLVDLAFQVCTAVNQIHIMAYISV